MSLCLSGSVALSQLLTCCRLHGIEEPSSLLRRMIADTQGPDGKVGYVEFVQQLAANRADAGARAGVSQLRSYA